MFTKMGRRIERQPQRVIKLTLLELKEKNRIYFFIS